MNTTKLLRTTILSTIVFFSVSFASVCSYALEPSIDNGGPTLTVYNNSRYDLTFTVTFPSHMKSFLGNVGEKIGYNLEQFASNTETISVIARQCTPTAQKLKFISNDSAKHEYWFGVPGQVSGKLKITSVGTKRINGTDCGPNEAWPENQALTLILQKGKWDYRTTSIAPFYDRDAHQGKQSSPGIDCDLKWDAEGNSGWQIVIEQADFDI